MEATERILSNQKGTEEAAEEAAEAEDEEQEAEGSHAADEITHLQTHRCSAKALSMAWNEKTSTALLGLTNNLMESVRITANAESQEGPPIHLEATPTLELAGHRTGVRALAVAADDSMFMSLSSESVKIWSASTGRCVRTMPSGYGLCGFFLAGNEHVLIGTKEGKLELYNIQLGELSQSLEAHSGAVYGLAQRPDQKGCVSCSADRTLRFFDFEFTKGSSSSAKLLEQTERSTELPDELLAVTYSPNSKYINVALLNHTVVVLFEDSLKFYLSLYGHRLPVMTLDVSDDSQLIASGSADKNVRLWSTQFGNCLRSLKAHNESVMQVRFLPGTHYLATAGRDHMLKLWDCDSYELISTLTGHSTEILAMALSQDAAFIITAGNDKQIRMWKRTQEQLFLSEERAKELGMFRELEDQFEQEVEREDLQATTSAPRPSRRTVESVRSTERLMEVLDEAKAAEEQLEADGVDPQSIADVGQGARHPCARAIAYINTLNSNNIYEVLLALPFSHAVLLLKVILRFFEAVSALPGGEGAQARSKALSAAATLQTPCQAALIAAYVHHSELATSNCRPMLLRLKQEMQKLLQAEKDRIGLTMAGLSHLQCLMKRSGMPLAVSAEACVRVFDPRTYSDFCAAMSSMFLLAFVTSISAVGRIVLHCMAGAYLQKAGILHKEMRKGISEMFVKLLLPCLLFTRILPIISIETLPKLAWLAVANLVYVSTGLLIGSLSVLLCRVHSHSLQRIMTATPAIGHANTIPFMLVGLIVSKDPAFEADHGTAQGYVALYMIMHSITLWGVGMNVFTKEKDEDHSGDALPALAPGSPSSTGQLPLPAALGRQTSEAAAEPSTATVAAGRAGTEGTETPGRLSKLKAWIPSWLNRPMGTAMVTAVLGFIPGVKALFVSGPLRTVFGAMTSLGTAGPSIVLLSAPWWVTE
eukprot:s1427_g11.t1